MECPRNGFTIEGEFFNQRSVDDGVLFGFHKMNQFVGMERIDGFHFYDLEKNGTPERIDNYYKEYTAYLNSILK